MVLCNREYVTVSLKFLLAVSEELRIRTTNDDKVNILHQETPKIIHMEIQRRKCTMTSCNKESVEVS